MIDADEGAAFGAAILAGVGYGAWPTVDEACDNAIRVAETIEPEVNALAHNYKAYKLLYEALRPSIDLIG